MSTIVFSDQSSVFFYIYCSENQSIQQHIRLERTCSLTMLAPKISARAKHPNKTQTFMMAVQTAMDIFEDQIGSLSRDTHLEVYKILVRSYKAALAMVWDSAQNADITLILETVQDKEMSELTEMAKKSQLPSPTIHVVKEKRDVPTLETITRLMMA